MYLDSAHVANDMRCSEISMDAAPFEVLDFARHVRLQSRAWRSAACRVMLYKMLATRAMSFRRSFVDG